MCQLFCISASKPIQLKFSWEAFARRGSQDGGNPDGWGVAYFDDRDVLLLREPGPAADSPLVRFLGQDGPSSQFIVSHLRRATQGEITLQNTQPFVRYMAGRAHVFAHNGHVSDLPPGSNNSWLTPLGDTDSERLFNLLLSQLEPLWSNGVVPTLKDRLDVINTVAEIARQCGAANFIYSDGITIFAHGHRHTIPGEAISNDPGLYILEHKDAIENGTKKQVEVPCRGVGCDDPLGQHAVVATIPLDDQSWVALDPGEIACMEQGRRIL
jgi:glutamine amidotransferase